ncbi:MAG: hypothetical protein JXR40_14625 [Pontiellaceae bacterium]|nr:hypothetical protein [Pontiellaceae bacterium]
MNAKKRSSAKTASMVLTVINSVALILLSLITLSIREKFVITFNDLGTRLPQLTAIFINMPTTLWILITLLHLAVIVCKENLCNAPIGIAINILFFLGLVAFWLIFAFAMMLSIQIITESLEFS